MSTRAPRESLRLFVAAPLPPEAESAVRAWQRSAFAGRDDLRPATSLHLTLCFIGEAPAGMVAVVAEALDRVTVQRLTVALGEPVFLPPRGRRSVVALRLEDPSGALVRLQGDVSAALAMTGVYEPPSRAYLPHLTVARFRRPGHHFSLHNVNFRELCLASVILYSSKLEKGGAVHTPLATFPAT